jgi:hypothetical protein
MAWDAGVVVPIPGGALQNRLVRKADPEERPTMGEICTDLPEVGWLVFGGADAGRVTREASVMPRSQSVSKAMLQPRLSETQARTCWL